MPGSYYADGQYQDTGYLNTYIKQMGFWNRSDATTLKHVTRKLQQFGYGDEFPADDQGVIDGPSWAILIDGSYLP